jgi:hypothetical protein
MTESSYVSLHSGNDSVHPHKNSLPFPVLEWYR